MLTITMELPRSSAWCSCRVRRSCFHAKRLLSTLPLFLAPEQQKALSTRDGGKAVGPEHECDDNLSIVFAK